MTAAQDRGHAALPDDERGAATTQLVLVVPVLLLMALLIVQFAVAWHAQHIAQYAAERALAAARVKDGSAAAGQAQGRASVAQLGSRVLTVPAVTVRRTAVQVSVRVEGAVMPVIPGLALRATGTASGAVERLTAPDGGTP